MIGQTCKAYVGVVIIKNIIAMDQRAGVGGKKVYD